MTQHPTSGPLPDGQPQDPYTTGGSTAAPRPQDPYGPTDPYGHQDSYARQGPYGQEEAQGRQDSYGQQDGHATPGGHGPQGGHGAQPPHDPQSGYGAQPHHGQLSGYGTRPDPGAQGGHGAQDPWGNRSGQGAYGAHGAPATQPGGPGAAWTSAPPPGIRGVHEGSLSGAPLPDDDAKLWGTLAHLSAVLGYVLGAGMLGWLGPLIIFLVYKDRDRFVRYNAAESLNAAIATVIIEVALFILTAIFALVTFGIGSIAFPIVAVPAIVHFIFAIIGAVKSNNREWWNYPINIRFIR